MFLLVKLLYFCKAVGRLGKAAYKRHLQTELGQAQGFFWRLYIITATASLKSEPAFVCVATENTKLAPTMMRQSRMIHCVQGDTGPARRTLLLHLAASNVTHVPVHNPTSMPGQMRGERIHSEAAVLLLRDALCLLQICISTPSLPPKLLSLLLFSITEDWVFSSAWNVHWKESSLFCSMCFC